MLYTWSYVQHLHIIWYTRWGLDIYFLYVSISITLINLNYMTTGYEITGQALARRFPFKVSTSEASFERKLVSVRPIKRWFTPDHFVIVLTSGACRGRCKNSVDAGSTFYWACRWSNEIKKFEYQCVLMLCTRYSVMLVLSFFFCDDYHNNLRQSNLKQL